MYLLKYNQIHDENIIRFEQDLKLLINTTSNNIDLTLNLEDYINYYNSTYKMLMNFNMNMDKLKLKYEFVFLFDTSVSNPTLTLNEINLISDKITTSDKIKKADYAIFCLNFDLNYKFIVNEYPYFILKIYKTDEYIQQFSFYENKILFLKELTNNTTTTNDTTTTTNNKIITLDFENHLLYYNYEYYKSLNNLNDLNDLNYTDEIISEHSDELEQQNIIDDNITPSYDDLPHKFVLKNNSIIVHDGPIYLLKKTLDENIVMLDGVKYTIEVNSTMNINLIYNNQN